MLVFIGATIRHTHLELVTDFTTETIIFAINRFIFWIGKPYLFISDNFKILIQKV